jgi:hypothetical protein
MTFTRMFLLLIIFLNLSITRTNKGAKLGNKSQITHRQASWQLAVGNWQSWGSWLTPPIANCQLQTVIFVAGH